MFVLCMSHSAALDPLFWVAHGAVERIFQKSLLSGVTSDRKFESNNSCSGHRSTGTKDWLRGFFFVNETVDAASLTNTELTNILDPDSDEYRDLVNFVYDTASFDWCSQSVEWFA